MQEPDGPPTGDTSSADLPESVAFVRFRIGGFPLAVEAGHVARVAPVPERTRLPGAPAPMVGIDHVAGVPTVLLALHERLGVEAESGDRRVVVFRTEAEPVGVLADGTSGLQRAPVGGIEPPAERGAAAKPRQGAVAVRARRDGDRLVDPERADDRRTGGGGPPWREPRTTGPRAPV